MGVRNVGLSLILLADCTSLEPPAPSVVPPSADAEVAEDLEESTEPTEPDASIDAQTLPWRWRSPVATGEPDRFMPMPASVVNGATTVEARALAEGGVQVVQSRRGRTRWTATVGEAHYDTASLVWAGDVFVAHYEAIASGAQVSRLDRASGKVVWTRPLQGLGPLGHSKYSNAVQIEFTGGELWVFGREASGAYVEVLDVADGHRVDHSLVEADLVDLQWREVESPAVWGQPGFDLPTGWTMLEGSPTQLQLTPDAGDSRTVTLPGPYGNCDTGAAIEHDGTLYLANACTSSTGAHLYALSLSDFTWTWETDLSAVGPIAHSAYANRVAIEWNDGRVLVFGDEAMGRYVEALDPADGSMLVNKLWPVR